MESIEIVDTKKQLKVRNACIDDAEFVNVSLQRLYFDNVSLAGTVIRNANMSDVEIEGAQLGGAYIHNIGLPPEGHPNYEPGVKQRPLRLENCDLENSIISNCNLSGVGLSDCNISGLKINGILVEDLLKEYRSNK